MANAITHQLAAAVVVGFASYCGVADQQQKSAKPLWGSGTFGNADKLAGRT